MTTINLLHDLNKMKHVGTIMIMSQYLNDCQDYKHNFNFDKLNVRFAMNAMNHCVETETTFPILNDRI